MLALCAESIGELDLGAGAVAMAGALHLHQRDKLIDSWTDNDPLLPKQPVIKVCKGLQKHEDRVQKSESSGLTFTSNHTCRGLRTRARIDENSVPD